MANCIWTIISNWFSFFPNKNNAWNKIFWTCFPSMLDMSTRLKQFWGGVWNFCPVCTDCWCGFAWKPCVGGCTIPPPLLSSTYHNSTIVQWAAVDTFNGLLHICSGSNEPTIKMIHTPNYNWIFTRCTGRQLFGGRMLPNFSIPFDMS